MDSWSDVAAHPAGGFIRATGRSGGMDVFHNDVLIWSQDVLGDWPRFTRVAVSQAGQVVVTAKGEGGQGWVITQVGVRDDGPTSGNDPIVPHWQGEVLRIYRCAPGDGTPLMIDGKPSGMFMWAVEGIRDILPNGTIVAAQKTFAGVFNGRNFGQYTERDGWVVGQSGNSVACLHVASDHFFTAHRGTTNEGVHFALQTNGDLAVVALTEGGPFARVFSPPYPPNEPIPVTPPVDPPIPPVVDPPQPPEPPTMEDTQLDYLILSTLDSLRSQFLVTNGEGKLALPSDTDQAKRAKGGLLNKAAYLVRQQGYDVSLESKGGDNTAIQPFTGVLIANDIIQTVETGKRWGRDFLSATGAGEECKAYLGTKGPAVAEKSVVPVDPNQGTPSEPKPPDPQQPPVDNSVLARLAALEVALAEQKLLNEGTAAAQKDTAERLAAIIDKPVTLPDDVVRVSTHKVRTGPVRVFGVNAGTYDGEIVRK